MRSVAAGLSALILLLSGVAWSFYRDLAGGLTTTDVIDAAGDNGNILLVGVDSRTDAQGNPLPKQVLAELHAGPDDGVLNSDTIIVVHFPPEGGRPVAISIPRDSYVDIPGYRRDKINAAYPATKLLTAQQLVKDGETDRHTIDVKAATAGRTALIKTVERLTGLQIDHYAEVNMLGFYSLTNAIGGVEVCLNAPVNEPLSGAHFPAGRQTISGGTALAFVRQRHGLAQGDLSRIRRQQVFLSAVANKILSSGTLTSPSKVSALIDVAKQSLVIDSGLDLLAFAQQASALAAGKLEFVTIPTEGTESNSRGDVLLVDGSKVRQFVSKLTGGQEPAPEPTRTVEPGSVTVDVRNASGATGLAAQALDQLAGAGYRRGDTDNTAARAASVVRYAGDDDTAARQVANTLGGLDVEQDGTIPEGHVRVYLGSDYRPVTRPSTTTNGSGGPGTSPAQSGGNGQPAASDVPCVD